MKLPPGVQRVRKNLKRGGEAFYYYWRPTRQKLPDPSDPTFEVELEKAKLALHDPPKLGTFAALLVDYKLNPSFRSMRPTTQRAYNRVFDLYFRKFATTQVAEIERPDILAIRDAIALDRPQAANQFVWVMSVVMQFAVERDRRKMNPCARLGKLKGGTHKRWPQDAIDYALKHLPEEFRRAIILALYTGQREGDCCSMRWSQYDGTGIEVAQQKTGATVWIPTHRDLKRDLNAWRENANAETILTNSLGRPWRIHSFATRFCTVMAEHPKLKGLVFHGLRKVAATRLAEAGCSTFEIASVTGHATLKMVELYTREADQKRRAKSAIGRPELVSDRD